jgi:hypothetical protein
MARVDRMPLRRSDQRPAYASLSQVTVHLPTFNIRHRR